MTSASKQTQFWLDARCGHPDARRTQSIDAGAVDAERPQRGRGMPAEWTQNARKSGRKTPAVWTQDARRVDAGRTQTQCQVISWQYCILFILRSTDKDNVNFINQQTVM